MATSALDRIRLALGIQTVRGLTERQIKMSAAVIAGLGGIENIKEYDACITRLRAHVNDATIVDGALLSQTGARGLIIRDNFVQVVYGPHVAEIVADIATYIENPQPNIDYSSVLKPKYKSALENLDIVYAPFNGKIVDLKDLPNEEFASGLVGPGIAIELDDNKMVSPVNGVVAAVFEQKHAIGIRTSNGAEIVVHVGLDTYTLEGVGFNPCVSKGDTIAIGDVLLEFDLQNILEKGGSALSPIVITNWREAGDVVAIARDNVRPGDGLFIVG